MIEVKVEDFSKYRPKLLAYACKLLKGRSFVEKDGELQAFAEDVVQDVYLNFIRSDLKTFVNDFHLENTLVGMTYRVVCNITDVNRKTGQYNIFKIYPNEHIKKELVDKDKTTAIFDQFNMVEEFKLELTDVESKVLGELIKGYKQNEITANLNLTISVVKNSVKKIREKFIKYESADN